MNAKRNKCYFLLRPHLTHNVSDKNIIRKMFTAQFPLNGDIYQQRNIIQNFLDAFGEGNYNAAFNACIEILTDDLPLREKLYKRTN